MGVSSAVAGGRTESGEAGFGLSGPGLSGAAQLLVSFEASGVRGYVAVNKPNNMCAKEM